MINREVIRELQDRRPFEPFSLHMSGGEVYEVRHPEVLAVGKNRMLIIDPDTDQMAICSMLHVTSVQSAQSTQ